MISELTRFQAEIKIINKSLKLYLGNTSPRSLGYTLSWGFQGLNQTIKMSGVGVERRDSKRKEQGCESKVVEDFLSGL